MSTMSKPYPVEIWVCRGGYVGPVPAGVDVCGAFVGSRGAVLARRRSMGTGVWVIGWVPQRRTDGGLEGPSHLGGRCPAWGPGRRLNTWSSSSTCLHHRWLLTSPPLMATAFPAIPLVCTGDCPRRR